MVNLVQNCFLNAILLIDTFRLKIKSYNNVSTKPVAYKIFDVPLIGPRKI